ncbi:MAG: hypothetical protein RR547_09235 [Raoultibacter sp.]
MTILNERGFAVFKKSPEQRIMQEADRIVSMKEDFDAVSWSRVTEIAKLLQEEHTEAQRLEWARELMSIARSNTWVLDKFGVAASAMTGNVIASGIEMQQDDHYLSNAGTPAASAPAVQQKSSTSAAAQAAPAPVEAEKQTFSQPQSAPQPEAYSAAPQNAQPVKSVESQVTAPSNDALDAVSNTGGLPRIPGFGLPDIKPEAAAGVIASLPKLDLFFSGADAFSTVASKTTEEDIQTEPKQPSVKRGFDIPFGPDKTADPASVHSGTKQRAVDPGQTTQIPPIEAARTTAIPPIEAVQADPGMGLLSGLPRAYSDDEAEQLSDAERELRALEVMYAMMAAENGELVKSDDEPTTVADVKPVSETQPVREAPAEPKQEEPATKSDGSPLSPLEVAENVKKMLFDLPEIESENAVCESHRATTDAAAEIAAQKAPSQQEGACETPASMSEVAASSLLTEEAQREESYIETKGALRKKRKKRAFGRHGGKAQQDEPAQQTSEPQPSVPSPQPAPIAEPQPQLQPEPQPESQPESGEAPASSKTSLEKSDLAQFKHVFSGKKGNLCLYEDADGHLVAVDPSRFA